MSPLPFYGRGVSFPLRQGPTGGVAQSFGQLKVEESLRIILGTAHGERVMRPEFGCNLRALAFAPANDATANLAKHYVEEGIARWEPRVEVVDVKVTPGDPTGALVIEVNYRLRATQEPGTLVYPLYLTGRAET
jgi:uncharacterized protein